MGLYGALWALKGLLGPCIAFWGLVIFCEIVSGPCEPCGGPCGAYKALWGFLVAWGLMGVVGDFYPSVQTCMVSTYLLSLAVKKKQENSQQNPATISI